MKRFLLFAGESYEPEPAIFDLHGDFDHADEALEVLRGIEWSKTDHGAGVDWAHLLDTGTGRLEVWCRSRGEHGGAWVILGSAPWRVIKARGVPS